MTQNRLPITRENLSRIWSLIRALAADPGAGPKATRMFAGLCGFLLTLNGLNVLNSYIGRDFMTAIADHNMAGFWKYLFLTLLVFGLLTLFAVLQRYLEESLGLIWRKWLTWRLFRRYAEHRVYWRLAETHAVENPDQRIAEDIKAFTTTTLSFVLMLLNGALTVIAFSGVLWTISPTLFVVAVCYATAGTWLTFRLGRPLIDMNYDQLDREAEFRASLIHLQEHADVLALSRRENLWIQRSGHFLEDLANNWWKIIGINRKVGFFTTGYNWLIQIIPVLVVAPLFIEGRVEFGVITQAVLAFTQLLGAFSLIVTQFQSISSFSAVVSRLTLLSDASTEAQTMESSASDQAAHPEQGQDRIVLREVTLKSQNSGRLLINSLTAELHTGQPVMVYGPDEAAGQALFRAMAGLWPITSGQILRPALDQILFVGERPYLCTGTLREMFLRPLPEVSTPVDDTALVDTLMMADATVHEAMEAVGLARLSQRFGGLDTRQDWDNVLSLEDQQLLVIARVLACKPHFVVLDRPGTALSLAQIETVYGAFSAQAITPITFDKTALPKELYGACLELKTGGKWRWQSGAADRKK